MGNIDININKCTVLFESGAMGPVATSLIRIFFPSLKKLFKLDGFMAFLQI